MDHPVVYLVGRGREGFEREEAFEFGEFGGGRGVRGEGSCNPVKVARPELLMEGSIVRTQAGQLDLHICAVIRRRERDLNY